MQNDIVPCCHVDKKASDFTGEKDYYAIADWQNSEYFKYMNDNLEAGNKISECNNCWKKEEAGLLSLRNIYHQTFIKEDDINNSWVKNALKHDNVLMHADIKTNNLCNFSCAMCNPADSTQIYNRWAKDKSNEFVQEVLADEPDYFERTKNTFMVNEYRTLLYALSKEIKSIKLLGGEPFIDTKLLTILDNVPADKASKVRLHFVSNGSVDFIPIMKRLDKFKYISVSVSLEGIGDAQDYIRKGSHWPEVENNILMFRDYCQHNIEKHHVGIVNTIQALSLEHMDKFIKWTHSNKLTVGFSLTDHPSYLTLDALGIDYVNTIRDNIKELDFNNSAGYIENESDKRIDEYLTHKYKPELKAKFTRYIEWYEQDSSLKMKDVMPKLYEEVTK